MTAFEPDGSRRRECGDNVHITTDQLGGQRARIELSSSDVGRHLTRPRCGSCPLQ
jgi:hypothetical protein